MRADKKIYFSRMSAGSSKRRMMQVMEIAESRGTFVTDAAESAVAVAHAFAALSELDLVRLNALARLRARGLPDGTLWSDLLHEAMMRALDGSRQWPQGVPFLAFLSGVMRSLGDEIWRRHRRERAVLQPDGLTDAACETMTCPAADQERVIAAVQAMAAIYRLFAGDATVLQIIAGLGNGLSPEEIQAANGLSPVAYDTARRRMRRTLLRAGLAREPR
jgi:RNA polymerase sigma-70 factor (ECF subfamily)